MRRWLVIALCAISTTLLAQSDTSEPEPPLMVPLEDCEVELTTLEQTCTDELTNLEADCAARLLGLGKSLTVDCDASQDAAVAAERRHYEPIVASLRVSSDEWKAEAEARGAEATLWKIVSGALAVGLLVSLVF